ncbi:MAG: serine/threonine-protein kinase [Gaiellaceae bacterium]
MRAVEHAVALREAGPLDRGLVLGRYRPLRPLGSGGSGSVWLVRDESAARDVALKVVPREGKAGSRAEREVEAAARLRHPRCLRALALERDDQHVYVAYEFVPGRTLREALRGGALDDTSAVEAAAQVLDALGHAHGKGVVHRDVKPSNVMLVDESEVSVRVLDFGLAQVSEAETLTAAGDVPGTLAYIAPERLAGDEASGAADVWAVGVILWEALVGRHPFSSVSPLETARRIQDGAPPLASLRPDLPRPLCAAVDRMLQLVPSRRPGAKDAAKLIRSGWHLREERPRAATSRSTLADRAEPAALAAVFAGAAAFLLPFFPAGWPLLCAALAALAALWSPSAGLALALAVPILPLGNLSLGLALAYLPLALGWLVLFARDARSGLLFAVGPLLAPVGALALAPVLVTRACGMARRAALAAVAVLAGAAVAGLTRSPLPLTGETPPVLGIAGEPSPSAAAGAVAAALTEHSALALEALVFAAAAAAVPYALRFRFWGLAGWGSGFLAFALLAPGGAVDPFPLLLAVWAATALLAVRLVRMPR